MERPIVVVGKTNAPVRGTHTLLCSKACPHAGQGLLESHNRTASARLARTRMSDVDFYNFSPPADAMDTTGGADSTRTENFIEILQVSQARTKGTTLLTFTTRCNFRATAKGAVLGLEHSHMS